MSLADLLAEYARTRASVVSPSAPAARKAAARQRLADLIPLVWSAERAEGVARSSAEDQTLGEIVKRPEFPALVAQIRALGARKAYRLHSLAAEDQS